MDTPLIILQISDLHILSKADQTMEGVITEQSFSQVLKYAHDKHGKADLILVTGDLVQNPALSSYQRIYKELEKYQTRTLCLPGNHDDFTLMQQAIMGKQLNCDKHVMFEHWQIICLNSKKPGSEGGYLAPRELDFLSKTLETQTDLNTLIAVHHHPLPTHSHWMDTMLIENSDEFFFLLNRFPQVKAITFGHIHQQLETLKDNKLILGTPSTCFQFKPKCDNYTLDDKAPGYRIFLLYPNAKIETSIYRLEDCPL